MPSFDIVSEVDLTEIKNAVEQCNKEVTNRFDFKGSDARVEQGDKVLTVFADDDFKLEQVIDVLKTKLSKRNVDIRCLEYGKVEKVSGNKVKQAITVKVGVETELAKKTGAADQGQQAESPGLHPGRRRARIRCQARPAAGLHCHGAQGNYRFSAAVQ